ncbi:MAG: hypothetical protein GC168_20650 [Candidatus Hydrogenedens sp.]|nr:hypothetical protein [Candidatus Hydrogenedens sp.]
MGSGAVIGWAGIHLRPASLRGVGFAVEGADAQFGRKTATHDYPLKDLPWVEDLGRANRRLTIEATLVGDDVIVQAQALEAAIETAGPAELVHPWYGTVMVTVVEHGRTRWSSREHRVARISFTCLRTPVSVPQPVAVTDGAAGLIAACDEAVGGVLAGIGDALGEVLGPAEALFGEATALIGEVTGVVEQAAAIAGLARLAATDPLLGAVGLFAKLAPGDAWAFATGLYGLVRAVGRLSDGYGGMRWTTAGTAAALGGLAAGTAAVPVLARADGLLPANAPTATITALTRLTGFASTAPAVPLTTASRRDQATARAATERLVTSAAAIEAARLVPIADWDSRTAALTSRGEIVVALGVAADGAVAAGDHRAWRALTALRATAYARITAAAVRLPAVVAYRPATVLPSAALAHRLYGDDPDAVFVRAADLVRRNRVAHPAFVPSATLEVIADAR